MPASPNDTPIQQAWAAFADSVRTLLVPQPDDRPLDQYLAFRDRVMTLVRSEAFVTALVQPARPSADADLLQMDEALLEELRAFPRAVEVAQITESAPEMKRRWWERLLGRAGTVAGSVKDLLENAPPIVKNGLTLFKELVSLFKSARAAGGED